MNLISLQRFHIAPGGNPAAPDTWVWQDRSADVNHKTTPAITATGGRADEVASVDNGVLGLEVDNAGGHYCTGNPMGRWYGLLTTGTPARWGTISGAAAFTTNATNGWGVPDVGTSWTLGGVASNWSASSGVGQRLLAVADSAFTAALNGADAYNGDATWVCFSSVIATGGPLIYGFQVRRVDANNYILFTVELSTSGSIVAKIRRNLGGQYEEIATSGTLAFTYSINQRIKVRCNWDGPSLRMKVWPEASAEPDAWTLTTADALVTGSQIVVFLWREAANTNAGTVTFFFDSLEVEAVEAVGTVPAWPVEWDPTARQSFSRIQIAGITRDLAQGLEPPTSPIYGLLSSQDPMGYWPLEDGALATSASSALPRGPAATVNGVTFESSDCPAGASSAAVLSTASASRITCTVDRWTIPQDGYSAIMYLRFPTLPPSATNVAFGEFFSTGTISRWVLYANNTSFTLEGYNNTTLTVTGGPFLFSMDPTQWFAIGLKTTNAGANVNWRLDWYGIGDPLFFVISGSYAGAAGILPTVKVTAVVDGMIASHLWIGDDQVPFITSDFVQVSTGFVGELDTFRILRLATQADIPIAIDAIPGEALGPQPKGGTFDLIRQSEQAGLGVLYEAGSALGYQPRVARYNRPVSLALSMTAGEIALSTPSATDDDLRLRNYWTVSRDGGGSATDSDPAHIALHRRRPDSVSINVQTDAVLPDHASWRVSTGTWPEMRWRQITLDLARNPALLTWWRGRRYGSRITISGVPSQGPIGADLDLIVEGWSQEISSHGWRVTLTCSPAKVWDVGIYDDPNFRCDSASTTLVGTQTTSSASWAITTVNPLEVWSTTSLPYTWKVAGEDVTVTAMTAAAGTGPYTQTATVTRSVNGIVKSHAANEPIHLTKPARWAL